MNPRQTLIALHDQCLAHARDAADARMPLMEFYFECPPGDPQIACAIAEYFDLQHAFEDRARKIDQLLRGGEL